MESLTGPDDVRRVTVSAIPSPLIPKKSEALQQPQGFEIWAKGASRVCAAFTDEDG